jgi:putative hydrolase of the HAD superfamily
MRLKALLFDMGGTLDEYHFDRESALAALPEIRSILAKAMGTELRLGDEGFLSLVARGEDSYRRAREKDDVELQPEIAWRDHYLKDYGPLPGLTPELGEALAFIVDTRFYVRSLRPEAPAALEALKARGLKLGVVSNVLSRGQVPRDLERYGIAGLFEAVLTSSEFGRRKPDPAILLRAAEMLGAAPGASAYVGDRVSRDVAGARRAGFAFTARIRNRYVEDSEPQEPRPDFVIAALDELVPAVERYERGETA